MCVHKGVARTRSIKLEWVASCPLAGFLCELADGAAAEEVNVRVHVLPHWQQLKRRHEALAVVGRKVINDL